MKEKWRREKMRQEVSRSCSFLRKKVVANREEYDTS